MDVSCEKTFRAATREEERFGRLRPSALLAVWGRRALMPKLSLEKPRKWVRNDD